MDDNLNQLTAEVLFRKYPLSEIINIKGQLLKKADGKKGELRQLVWDHYRGILEASDAVKAMSITAGELSSCLATINPTDDSKSRGLSTEQNSSTISKLRDIACAIKILFTTPVLIYVLLDDNNYLQAASSFLIADACFKDLQRQMTFLKGLNISWNIVEQAACHLMRMQSRILEACEAALVDTHSDLDFTSLLLALCRITQNIAMEEAIIRFMKLRSSSYEAIKKLEPAEAVLKGCELLDQTVLVLEQIKGDTEAYLEASETILRDSESESAKFYQGLLVEYAMKKLDTLPRPMPVGNESKALERAISEFDKEAADKTRECIECALRNISTLSSLKNILDSCTRPDGTASQVEIAVPLMRECASRVFRSECSDLLASFLTVSITLQSAESIWTDLSFDDSNLSSTDSCSQSLQSLISTFYSICPANLEAVASLVFEDFNALLITFLSELPDDSSAIVSLLSQRLLSCAENISKETFNATFRSFLSNASDKCFERWIELATAKFLSDLEKSETSSTLKDNSFGPSKSLINALFNTCTLIHEQYVILLTKNRKRLLQDSLVKEFEKYSEGKDCHVHDKPFLLFITEHCEATPNSKFTTCIGWYCSLLSPVSAPFVKKERTEMHEFSLLKTCSLRFGKLSVPASPDSTSAKNMVKSPTSYYSFHMMDPNITF